MRPLHSIIVPVLLAFSALPALADETAVFAGGCFWTMESAFEKVPGVSEAVSGFAGGTVKNPTYEQVVGGGTGHLEAVQVSYDPKKVSYAQLVEIFFHSIDPTQTDGQVCDLGSNYLSAIFVVTSEQRKIAEAAKAEVAASLKKEIATSILSASPFYAAGPEHQDFASKNPAHYSAYRVGCGRDRVLKKLWGEKAWPSH